MRVLSMTPSLRTTTIWLFSTVTRRIVLIKRSTRVPSSISITSRGPVCGSAKGSCSVGVSVVPRLPVGRCRRAGSVLRTSGTVTSFVVSERDSSLFLAGCDAGLRRLDGTRPLPLLGGAGAPASAVATVVSGLGVGTVKSSGVGWGVGAAATSSRTTGGSAMRAPTDETRLDVLPFETTVVTGSAVGF